MAEEEYRYVMNGEIVTKIFDRGLAYLGMIPLLCEANVLSTE